MEDNKLNVNGINDELKAHSMEVYQPSLVFFGGINRPMLAIKVRDKELIIEIDESITMNDAAKLFVGEVTKFMTNKIILDKKENAELKEQISELRKGIAEHSCKDERAKAIDECIAVINLISFNPILSQEELWANSLFEKISQQLQQLKEVNDANH